MTNGERWRTMTDEQIAEVIIDIGCGECPSLLFDMEDELGCPRNEKRKSKCRAAIIKWLRLEDKEGYSCPEEKLLSKLDLKNFAKKK